MWAKPQWEITLKRTKSNRFPAKTHRLTLSPTPNSGAKRDSEVIQVDLVETPGSPISTRVKCPCYEHFDSQIKNLTREIMNMKERINYTQENSSPIVRLKEENAVLRAQLSSLKEKYDTILEERDSLKLTVKIISKDLYSDMNTNPTLSKTPSLVLENRKSQGYVNLTASEEKTRNKSTPTQKTTQAGQSNKSNASGKHRANKPT